MKLMSIGFLCGCLFLSAFAQISAVAEARAKPKPIIVDPPGRARILFAGDCGYVEIARRDFVVSR